MYKLGIAVAVAIAAMFSTAQADTIYVDADCPGPGNGSEAEPYCSIQTAIDNAGAGDAIVVADGTYTGIGNRDLDFGGRSIELRSENGPDNCLIDLQGATRAFHFHSGESAAAVVDGFTVENGDVTGGTPSYGGAVFCENGSSPTFAHCVFRNNNAYDGGAAHCRGESQASFEQCAFISNAAVFGGALSVRTAADLAVTDCHFEGNAGTLGGAVHCNFADAAIHNCRFYDNTAMDISNVDAGGGAIMFLRSYAPISDSHFAGHLTLGPGTIGLYKSNPVISNCVLEQNQALWGAGIFADPFSIPMTNMIKAPAIAKEPISIPKRFKIFSPRKRKSTMMKPATIVAFPD